MPVRMRRTTDRDHFEADPQIFVYGPGTWTFFDDEFRFRSREDARDAWPRYRRAAWALTRRYHVPQAAIEYDGLTARSWQWLWSSWNHTVFDLAAFRECLADDRETLDAFEADDPDGARGVADCLALYRGDLDRLDAIAVDLSEAESFLARTFPQELRTGRTYGQRAPAERV